MKREEHPLTNLTKLFVLAMLNRSPKHGYDLITEFKARTGKNLSPGQIYPLLNRLQKKGLIVSRSEYYGRRERKVYYLTEGGRIFFQDLKRKLEQILE